MSENLIWHSFSALNSALGELECLSKMRQPIYTIIAAILHLGNVNFVENHSENAQIDDEDGSRESLEFAANLLAIDSIVLESIFLERKIKIRNDTTA